MEEEGKTVEDDKCEEILTTLQQISEKLVSSVQVSDDVALIGQLNKIKVMFFAIVVIQFYLISFMLGFIFKKTFSNPGVIFGIN